MFIGKDSELERVYAFYRSHWPGPELQEEGEGAEEAVEALDDDGYDCAEECEEDLLEDEEDDDDDDLCKSLGVVPASCQLVPESPRSSAAEVTPEHKAPEPPSQTPSAPSVTSYVRKAPFQAESRSDLRKQRIDELKLLELAYFD